MLLEAPVNILLVDNQPRSLQAVESILESLRQNLVVAHSGEEALESLRHQDFAVILLNLQPSEIDALQLAVLLREQAQHTPIIFITPSTDLWHDASRHRISYPADSHPTPIELASLGTVDYVLSNSKFKILAFKMKKSIGSKLFANCHNAICKRNSLTPIVPELLLSKVAMLISLFKKTQQIKQQAAQLAATNQTLEQEITRRKQAEAARHQCNQALDIKLAEHTAALRTSESVYRTLIETIPHGIQEIDTQGIITFSNPSYYKMLGYERDELIGKPAWGFCPEPERLILPNYIAQLVQEQPAPTPYFGTYITKDGKLIDVQVDWNYKRDERGQVIGFICVITDITFRKQATLALEQLNQELELRVKQRTTELEQANERLQAEVKERRQAEQALRASEVRFKAIVENSYDIITLTDEQDNIYYQNSARQRILGHPPVNECSKRPVHEVHPEDIPKVQAAMQAILAQPEVPVTVEYRMRRANGSWAWLESVGTNWLGNPDIKAIVANTRDISDAHRQATQRKQAENALRQQIERERLIIGSIQRIRETLALDVILATTVEEVRKFLQVDRVLVYQIRPDGTGYTIAESVVPGYPQILGQHFPEEIFPQEFHQLYCQGRIRAITDLETDEVAPCLIDFLRQWGVQSKLVVPIVYQKKLWGLLIGHHCCQPRHWQPLEMELLQQLAIQLAIAIQQADLYEQVQLELAERKQAQEALRQARDQLEIRIQERTAELTLINTSLKAEIRDRIAAEEALRQSQHFIEQIADTAPTMIYVWELAPLRNTYLNRYGLEFLGYSHSEIRAKGEQFFQEILHPDEAEMFAQTVQRLAALQDGEILENEFRLKNAQGEWRWLHTWDLVFTRTTIGTPAQLLGTAIDITVQKQAEELRHAWEAEKKLRRLQLRFFSMVSHEFRTPLSTILGSAQILKSAPQTWTEEKKLRNLSRIEMAAKNMTQLLDDLLTINRAESGKLEFNPQPIPLEPFCRRLVEDLPFTTNPKHQIKLAILGKCRIANLDEKLLRSILTNLLSNAVKYSPKGGQIHFLLKCESQSAIFQIEDSGIGIPPEDQNHLFELFHRGKNVNNLPGTGLGLSVVKKCLDLQGGTISINSEVGVGTTVIVTLPLTLAQPLGQKIVRHGYES
jgi:PAS domain S-box-containing protein